LGNLRYPVGDNIGYLSDVVAAAVADLHKAGGRSSALFVGHVVC